MVTYLLEGTRGTMALEMVQDMTEKIRSAQELIDVKVKSCAIIYC